MPFAARKEVDPEVVQASRRFIQPDFDRIGIWLLERLSHRYTHMDQKQILSWLRGVMASSAHLFLTNDNAVLLASMESKDMDPLPAVHEVFCLCKDESQNSGAALYEDLVRWAHQLGAKSVTVMNFTDVPKAMIEEVTGTEMKKRNAYSLAV